MSRIGSDSKASKSFRFDSAATSAIWGSRTLSTRCSSGSLGPNCLAQHVRIGRRYFLTIYPIMAAELYVSKIFTVCAAFTLRSLRKPAVD
jgi:hypothetical protein